MDETDQGTEAEEQELQKLISQTYRPPPGTPRMSTEKERECELEWARRVVEEYDVYLDQRTTDVKALGASGFDQCDFETAVYVLAHGRHPPRDRPDGEPEELDIHVDD